MKTTKRTSLNSRMNLCHTLASNEIEKPTSTLAEKFYYSKNSTYYSMQQINEECKETRGNGNKRTEIEKLNKVACGKRTVVKNSKNGKSETVSKALLERTNQKLIRKSRFP